MFGNSLTIAIFNECTFQNNNYNYLSLYKDESFGYKLFIFTFSEVRISNSIFSDNVVNECGFLLTYSRLFFDNVLV